MRPASLRPASSRPASLRSASSRSEKSPSGLISVTILGLFDAVAICARELFLRRRPKYLRDDKSLTTNIDRAYAMDNENREIYAGLPHHKPIRPLVQVDLALQSKPTNVL
jgi:hypothetical protein